MARIVLIVDDDAEMLASLKEGLDRYRETFAVVTAESGEKAVDLLGRQPVSILITDLKMPGMDGFELLSHVMEGYPDIPVIIMTGYSTPEMKRMAQRGGAVGYISKPFLVEKLARKIIVTLRQESDGGTLHGVSSGIFLQLIEMEARTCTIRLRNPDKQKNGVLFFKEGELFDARYGNLQGVNAAYEIFSWDDVSITIQNGCARKEKKIREDLQAVLLEAMRRKDEGADESEPDAAVDEPAPVQKAPASEDPDRAAHIRSQILSAFGDRAGLEDVYPDEKWNSSVARLDAVTRALGCGRVKLALIDKGRSVFQILLASDPAIVVEVGPKCPRDKLITLLDRSVDEAPFRMGNDG